MSSALRSSSALRRDLASSTKINLYSITANQAGIITPSDA